MPNDQSSAQFQSILAPFMEKFLQEKRACGYRYHEPTRILRRLDDFLFQEGLKLRVRDVDLSQGIVTVRQGKFRKDRLVPLALSLVNRLRKYAASLENRPLDAILFPAPDGGPFSLRTVYGLFRKLLLKCGIAHAGRGKGPRIHDLRHTFAVHTLLRWYRDGEDLDAKLPLLATYLGHQHLSGTQRYLHLTAELFPEITARVDALFGEVIPRRSEP